jgi:imidazolonepropionase-like amidohydrolase
MLTINNQTEGDSHIHNLAIEAGIAAKYAGLSKREAVDLVSRNIEKILRLNSEHGEGKEDIVIWEGDPLELGASVVLSISGKRGVVGGCWLDGR